MGVYSKIIRKSQFMLSTKVYFVLKMYFHILRIFVLYDNERYTYDHNHIFSTLIHRCYPLNALHCRCYLTNVAVNFVKLVVLVAT